MNRLFFSDHEAPTIRTPGKSQFFLSFCSLSLYLFSSSLSLLVCFPSSLIPLFAPHPISFSFSFSLFSHFPISFLSLSFFSSLTFLFLLLIFFPSTEFIKVGETSSHFPLSHLSSPCIFFIFLYFFYFFFITSFNTWLNVSHLFQVHHMAHSMCHFPRVSCGITWSCHVSPDSW